MAIPIVARRYTMGARAAVAKFVTCEECGCEYVYRMEREAQGHGTSLYFVDNRGAERRALKAAERALARKLGREIEVVPCPKCGCVQEAMVRLARRRHLRWLRKTAKIVIVLTVIYGALDATAKAASRRIAPRAAPLPGRPSR